MSFSTFHSNGLLDTVDTHKDIPYPSTKRSRRLKKTSLFLSCPAWDYYWLHDIKTIKITRNLCDYFCPKLLSVYFLCMAKKRLQFLQKISWTVQVEPAKSRKIEWLTQVSEKKKSSERRDLSCSRFKLCFAPHDVMISRHQAIRHFTNYFHSEHDGQVENINEHYGIGALLTIESKAFPMKLSMSVVRKLLPWVEKASRLVLFVSTEANIHARMDGDVFFSASFLNVCKAQ